MNKRMTDGMMKATELTRSGKLNEATALIQSLLQGAADPSPGAQSVSNDITIEGVFTRLDGPAPEQAAPKPAAQPKPVRRASGVRRGLGETLRKIAAGGMPRHPGVTNSPVDLPAGARFLTLSHTSPHGQRAYRLYVPAKASTSSMPLIVMLHGCTQTPEDFAAGTGMNALAEEFGCLIAYPAQPSGANAQKCWNWFRPEDQAREHGEPALIAGLVQDILRDHNGDPSRVYIAGLSAGAAAALIIAEAYPDIFSAVGVHSGLPSGAARDIPSAFSAMRSGSTGKSRRNPVPTIIFHGTADSTVHPDNGRAVESQALTALAGLKRSASTGTSAGGRRFTLTSHSRSDGRSLVEHWQIDGAGHAWAGGLPAGSYTDPTGPDASREMLRFFLQHHLGKAKR